MVQSGSGALADSRQAGRELASALARGVQPQPVPVRLTLQAGEFCVGTTAGVILQWLDSEGEYTKKSGGYLFGGGGVGLAYNAVRLSSNLMGNSIRKARASRQAASQWRTVESGNVFVTDRRFAIQGARQWIDLWYQEIRMADCNGRAIELEIGGLPRTALQIPTPDYWFVMFNKLAYDRILLPPDVDGQAYREWAHADVGSTDGS